MDLGILDLLKSEELKASIIEDSEAEKERGKDWGKRVDKQIRASYAKRGFVTDEQFGAELKRVVSSHLRMATRMLKLRYESEFEIKILNRLTLKQTDSLLDQRYSIEKQIRWGLKGEERVDARERIKDLDNLIKTFGPTQFIENDIEQLKEQLKNNQQELEEYIEFINGLNNFEMMSIENAKQGLAELQGEIKKVEREIQSLENQKAERSKRYRVLK